MEMERLRRIRYVTENYHSLQGLRYLPALIFALVVIVGERIPLYRPGDLAVRFVLLGVSLVSQWLIGRYYRSQFGEIEAEQKRTQQLWFIFLIFMIFVEGFLRPSISLFGLSVAAFWLYYGWRSQGIRTHYAVMGGLTAILSFLPLVITPQGAAYAWVTTLIIITAIIGMVMDHGLLVRLMREGGEQ